MILLLSALALAADPAPGAPVPAAPTVDAGNSDEDEVGADPEAVLATLAEDLDRWGSALLTLTRMLERGDASSQVVEHHELAIRLVLVRYDLAELRLAHSEPPADDDQRGRLGQAREAVGELVQAAVEARLAHELGRINAALVRGRTAAAAPIAVAAARLAEAFRDRLYAPERIDAASVALARVAALGDPGPALEVAVTCARRCVGSETRVEAEGLAAALRRAAASGIDPIGALDEGRPALERRTPTPRERPAPTRDGEPEHAVVRIGPSLALPLRAGTFEAADVRRGLSGAIDVAVAPTPTGCVAGRVGFDRYSATPTSAPLDLTRARGELGWCPRLGAIRTGRATIAARAVVGVGVARSVARRDSEVETLWGLGPHGRVEVGIHLGALHVVPEVGLSPYGRAASLAPGASRGPYRFLDRATVAIGVQAGF